MSATCRNSSPGSSLLFLLPLWGWCVWGLAEYWQGNPNYSYGWAVPLLALGFGIRRYLLAVPGPGGTGEFPVYPRPLALFAGFGLGLVVALLEYARQDVWHPTITIWAVALLTAGVTLLVLRTQSGVAVMRAELFPVLFLLTAVPWPPRFEQPITASLMQWVAAATTEILHWMGIEAQSAGGAIALRTGLVGITEACSGIRSLQAGIMFGLAVGEWFLLRPARRWVLLFAALILAVATNLVRTLALTLQAERHGIDSVERVHDLIGNIMITALIMAIWLIGKFLAQPVRRASVPWFDVRPSWRGMFGSGAPVFRMLAIALLAGIFLARVVYGRLEARDQTQTTPFFTARADPANQLSGVPKEVWNELRPTSGEYIRHNNTALPGGGANCFHFFWKPSPWNRFALVHRPDICMPGVGWTLDGPPSTIEAEAGGRLVRCYLFRFERGNAHALELWGAWRNGDLVPLDYEPGQVLGLSAPPSSLQLQGKRRSATEIVACNIVAEGSRPDENSAMTVLRSVFQYQRP